MFERRLKMETRLEMLRRAQDEVFAASDITERAVEERRGLTVRETKDVDVSLERAYALIVRARTGK